VLIFDIRSLGKQDLDVKETVVRITAQGGVGGKLHRKGPLRSVRNPTNE
jgi:hypothetical protein